jgi:DNA-binding SARP family transcriptional activator/type II secretory pathway predicted ATPase ExeA
MTSFRILGPIEAWTGERRITVGGPKQLALLAFFLLHANRAVPNDALIDALWGPARSGTDNRLQMAVARLRKALTPLGGSAEPPLRTVSGGYLLSVAPGQLDAEAFAERLEDGLRALETSEPGLALELLNEALALWRGPPLAEVAFEDFAQGEIRRLEELKLAALENRIDAGLQLGRDAQLIGELEALLAADPLRERVAAQLMLALYRSGRQAEALEVYQRTRVKLAEQLGLEPGPRLTELQAEILEHAASLNAADGNAHAALTHPLVDQPPRFQQVSAPLPSRVQPQGPTVFADRQSERERLAQMLKQARSSGHRSAFVTGEAGIGKTRLVSEVAREAHATGTLVLAGRCDEGLDLPYQPFVEALEHLVEHAPIELLEDHIAGYGDSVARLVPALADRVSGEPTVMPQASEFERYVLFRAIEGLLAAASAGGSVLLVLEDLHWADLPTLKLLRRLLASAKSSPLVLLGTCRVTELPESHPLRELLADLHREPHVLRIDLAGLEGDEVIELLRGIAQGPLEAADDEFVSALEASTGGNPFFITELVRSLVETGALAKEGGRWQLSPGVELATDLPLSITETLARRIGRADEDVRRCLSVSAVVGTEFEFELVSQVMGGQAAAEPLDQAVASAVLLGVPGRPTHFRFAHALMQRFLYRGLGVARRAELHRRVALAMEAMADENRWPTAELARHWVEAGDAHAGTALGYAIRAGDEALAKLAPDEARRWYQISLQLLSQQPDRRKDEVCELLIKRGEAERHAGELHFRETLLEAAELAQRLGDDRKLVRAALANTRGMQSETGIVDEARLSTLDAALRVVGHGHSRERARLLAMQAAELMYSGEWERRARLSDEALAIARRLKDQEALSTVLNLRFVTLLAPQTYAERQANTDEAVAAAEHLNDHDAQFYAYHWRAYSCIEAGDISAARGWATREREIAERFRQPTALWLARADAANLAIVAGELEHADRLAGAAFEIGRHSEPDALACYVAQRVSIAFESGRIGELVPMLEQAVQDNPGVPGFRADLALALSEDMRFEEARAIIDQAAAASFRDIPQDVTWLAVACIYAHVSSRLGCLSAAETLYALLEPWAEQIAFPAFGVYGPVELYLGSLALALEDVDGAERHLAKAAQAAAQAGAPLWEARAASLQTRVAEIAR